MAKIIRHEWTSKGLLGKRMRHVVFGYTLAVNTGMRKREIPNLTRGPVELDRGLNFNARV